MTGRSLAKGKKFWGFDEILGLTLMYGFSQPLSDFLYKVTSISAQNLIRYSKEVRRDLERCKDVKIELTYYTNRNSGRPEKRTKKVSFKW